MVPPGRDLFLRRGVNQDGVFLDRAYLAQRYRLSYAGDVLNGVPDLQVPPMIRLPLDAPQMVR